MALGDSESFLSESGPCAADSAEPRYHDVDVELGSKPGASKHLRRQVARAKAANNKKHREERAAQAEAARVKKEREERV